MKASDMWELFIYESNLKATDYEAWAFGDDPDRLAELVLQGIKTSTASAYALYALDGEPLPEIDDYSVILDSKGEAKCIIRTTKVSVVPFDEVSEEHAFKEGEGDRSLAYWREVHRKFFATYLEDAGLAFNEKMKVVCEEFELVYQ